MKILIYCPINKKIKNKTENRLSAISIFKIYSLDLKNIHKSMRIFCRKYNGKYE